MPNIRHMFIRREAGPEGQTGSASGALWEQLVRSTGAQNRNEAIGALSGSMGGGLLGLGMVGGNEAADRAAITAAVQRLNVHEGFKKSILDRLSDPAYTLNDLVRDYPAMTRMPAPFDVLNKYPPRLL